MVQQKHFTLVLALATILVAGFASAAVADAWDTYAYDGRGAPGMDKVMMVENPLAQADPYAWDGWQTSGPADLACTTETTMMAQADPYAWDFIADQNLPAVDCQAALRQPASINIFSRR